MGDFRIRFCTFTGSSNCKYCCLCVSVNCELRNGTFCEEKSSKVETSAFNEGFHTLKLQMRTCSMRLYNKKCKMRKKINFASSEFKKKKKKKKKNFSPPKKKKKKKKKKKS